jgi:phosphinothricin acetyltransferase
MTIQPMEPRHWPRVRAIYIEGILTGNATFEGSAPEWDEWDARHHSHSRLVAIDEDGIAGWAALSPVSVRHVYRGVAEVSIYIAESARGKGVGRRLLERLIETSEENGIWTLQASIFPENDASLRLHHRAGFRMVGERERIACLAGRWRSTIQLERRSSVVGIAPC